MGKGYVNDANLKIYYVYAWYFKSTNEIFHIGKGKGDRYKERKVHRNKFFINILQKYASDVDVKILIDNLTNDESLAKEKKLIAFYKKIGQCKTNFHEGGSGGYTGKYNDPERNRKISIAAQKRVGDKNAMYGKHHTQEAKNRISAFNKGKKLSSEHVAKLIAVNTGRIKTVEERMKLSIANKGKIIDKKSIVKGIKTQINYVYELSYNNNFFAVCLGGKSLSKFCKQQLNISISILGKIIDKKFVPKFNRHKWINKLCISKIYKEQYQLLNDYFVDSTIKIVDVKYFEYLKKYIHSEKDYADLLRYRKINPSIRK